MVTQRLSIEKNRISDGDISSESRTQIESFDSVSCDIETDGLNFRSNRIHTIQLAAGGDIYVVRIDSQNPPTNVIKLLRSNSILKIFHHAPFDLRFIRHHWGTSVNRVACTKIAARIIDPHLDRGEYSLKSLLYRHLGIEIDKSLQKSNWSGHLSDDQLTYATNDVAHLEPLLTTLLNIAKEDETLELISHAFDFLPWQAEVNNKGIINIFEH